jgi:cell surface protein SprA
MRGKPDLFRVRYLYAGLRNLRRRSSVTLYNIVRSASGELWLNDIYLGSVKRDIDFTSSVSGGINFGNVIRLNANWRRTGPDYRGLQQRRGSGSLSQSYGFNGKTDLHNFIPLFGFRVPLSGNYSRSATYPKFSPNSDTEIEDKALQDSLRTESTTRGFSTTLTRKGSKNPLLKYTFDKINANFSMSQTRMRSPTRTDTTTRMSGTLDYQMSWSKEKDIRLFKNYKLRYWLNSLSYRMSASRVKGRSYKFFNNEFIPDRRTWNAALQQSGSATYVPFRSLTSSFKMALNRDLRLPHKFAGIDIGREINRNHSLQISYKPPPVWILKAFSPDFSFGSGYNEDSSPNVKRPGDPIGVRNVGSRRSVKVKARFGLGDFFKSVFKKLNLEEKVKEEPPKQPPQPPVPSGAQADTTGAAAGEGAADEQQQVAKPATKRDPLFPIRKLGGILSRIRKLEAGVQQRTTSRYSRIPGRPSLEYQLGLTKRSSVKRRGITYNNPEDFTQSIGFNLSSGVEITDNIDVAGKYSRNFSTREFRESEFETRTGNWPDISVSWKGLENFSLFRSLIGSASANFGYRKNWTESGTKGTVDSRSENLTITPSLSTSWNNGVNSTASVLITKQTTDSRGSKNENSQLSVTLDVKKSFTGGEKGFRIPLPFVSKRIKFRSKLDSSLGITYSRRGGKRFLPGSDRFDELPTTTLIKVSPRLTYNFSSSLNGSFFADYSRGYSDATNQTTTTVRVGITTVITF